MLDRMMRLAKVTVVGALMLGLVACGTSSAKRPATALADLTPPPSASLSGGCQAVATHELTDVSRRIYAQAAAGRGVVSAVKRLQRTTALADALQAGDTARVKAVFLQIRHQIVRIQLFHDGRRIYAFGRAPSFAPVTGTLRTRDGRIAGTYVLAVTDRTAYSGLVKRLTGADAVFRSEPGAAPARAGFHTVTLKTRAYPSGPLRIDLQIPDPASSLCGANAADTRLDTIGYVGRRLLTAESHSRAVDQTLRHVAQDPAFRRATAANDPVAIRHAIIFDFFRDHAFHIVRVRVTRGSKLVYDLGGPYALQPATAKVTSPNGQSSATFSLAVQDDTGYIKLMHRFTGADVQLVSPLGKVPGSNLEPGPDAIPAHGPVTYRGRRYLADSFDGTAFPSGTLRVSLLVPAS